MRQIDLGSNKFIDCDAVLIVNGQEVFRLRSRDSDGKLICDFDLRTEDGARIAKIAKNHVVGKVKDGYAHYIGERESYVKDSNGNFVAGIREIGREHIVITGDFWIDGLHVQISDNEVKIGGMVLVGNTFKCRKAIIMDKNGFHLGSN
jgi:hypothetical protein